MAVTAAVALGVLMLVPPGAASLSRLLSGTPSTGLVPVDLGKPGARGLAPAVVPAASLATLQLDTTAQPMNICAENLTNCPAAAGESRVQLSAQAAGGPTPSWPAVQVAFVIETTAYDGTLGTDRSNDLDVCAQSSGTAPACEESNGVPFFIANAQLIANAIQAANPHSAVSFALVDYYDARGEVWDDTDGPEYNVDIGQFVAPAQFGGLVTATFQANELGGLWYNWDSDLDNNFLDSSSIAALYGAIIGSALDWSPNAHHVIVWMGSSAPRDPSYIENYCVSPSQWNIWYSGNPPTCWSQTCEPAYLFASGASPNCEGWVRSQDGNPKDSIAALAHNAPACTTSIGGVCTVDAIDLYTTPTDPYSQGWPAGSAYVKAGGGPGGPQVQADVAKVLLAGCDISAATGGSWSGPAYFTCPNGQPGDLQYTPFGASIEKPNLNNPTLFNAFRSISFGPVLNSLVARGTNESMFQYVAFGSIAVAPNPQWTASCSTPSGFSPNCQLKPIVGHRNGATYFGWNWSTVPAQNAMYLGDVWTAAFNVMATGPPYAVVPVDACTTIVCVAGGSGAVSGIYTLANYWPPTNKSQVNQSFPLAQVSVEPTTGTPSGPPPPGAPPPPPGGLPVPVIEPIPIAAPLPVLAQLGISTVSVQATAAGFLGAGFMRVGMKNRPIAMKIAAKSGLTSSRFESAKSSEPGIGRFV